MNQLSTPFADLVATVLPDTPAARLARMCDVDNRTAQRWITGQLDPPEDVVRFVEDQAAALRDFHPGPAIDEVAARAEKEGIDVEVLGAWVLAKYATIVGRSAK